MPNELEAFDKLSVTKKIPEADDLLAYYRIHAELCKLYQSEIEYVNTLLKELRAERVDFYENKIGNIRSRLERKMYLLMPLMHGSSGSKMTWKEASEQASSSFLHL